MNLPEAVMAALPLAPDGRLVVVGDHRQMPPIVKHDWASEPRRTFQEFRSYESLFMALLPLEPPMVKFEESFRLHADMAEFLRREVYAQDGIDYHSKRQRGARGPPDRRRLPGGGAGAGAPAGGRGPRRSGEPGAQPVRATADRAAPGAAGGNSRGDVNLGTAMINVDQGETVHCTFVNEKERHDPPECDRDGDGHDDHDRDSNGHDDRDRNRDGRDDRDGRDLRRA